MDRYMRAYRDPKSPLTPLTPLGALSAFTFNINETTTPQQSRTPANTPSSVLAAGIQHTLKAALGGRFSEDFQRLRNIFEQSGRGNTLKRSVKKEPRVTRSAQSQQQQQEQQHQQQRQLPNGIRIKKEREDKENNRDEGEAEEDEEAQNERFMTAIDDSKIFLNVPRQRQHTNQTRTPTTTPQQPQKRSFLQASPVAPKPLSPRIASLLEQAGAANLKGLFQREEIDSAVLRLMKPEDLKYLGIEDEEDIRRIRGLITGAWNFVKAVTEKK